MQLFLKIWRDTILLDGINIGFYTTSLLNLISYILCILTFFFFFFWETDNYEIVSLLMGYNIWCPKSTPINCNIFIAMVEEILAAKI